MAEITKNNNEISDAETISENLEFDFQTNLKVNDNDFWRNKDFQKFLERHSHQECLMNELLKMIQERIMIHYNFVNSLNSWTSKWKAAFSKNLDLKSKCNKDDAENIDESILESAPSDSLDSEFDLFFQFLDLEGYVHTNMLQHMESAIYDPLLSIKSELFSKSPNTGKTFYQVTRHDFEDSYKCWKAKYNKMNSSKDKYHSALRTWEAYERKVRAASAIEQAVESGSSIYNGSLLKSCKSMDYTDDDGRSSKYSSSSDSSVSNKKFQKLGAHKESALKAYKSSYDEMTAYLPVYEKNMKELCEKCLSYEKLFLETIGMCFSNYSTIVSLQNNSPKLQQCFGLAKRLGKFNITNILDDTANYIGFRNKLPHIPFEESAPNENEADVSNVDGSLVPRSYSVDEKAVGAGGFSSFTGGIRLKKLSKILQ